VDVVRWGKPSNAFQATLRPAATKDFEKLVEVCLSALIADEVDVLISFAYTMKFPEDFPRGICMSKESNGSNVHRIKAKRLLVWLNENGYTAATVEMLGIQKRLFAENFKKSSNLF